uniref:Chromo domain-containing protein n=1 Tax=Strongyloides stercoralis TaxID=6248 RepID=A0A0K0EPI9_STRER
MDVSSRNQAIIKGKDFVNGEIVKREDKEDGVLYKVKWNKSSFKKCPWEPSESLSEILIKKYEDKTPVKVLSIRRIGDRNGNGRTSEGLATEGVDDICKDFGNWICQVEYSNESIGWVYLDDIPDLCMLRSYIKKRKKVDDVATNSKTKRGPASEGQPRRKRSKNGVVYCGPVAKRRADEDTRYFIEKIVDHRTIDGVKQYRIRWSGYTSDDDTWQTIDTFDDINFVKHYDDMVARKEREKEPDVKDEEWTKWAVSKLCDEQFGESGDSDVDRS